MLRVSAVMVAASIAASLAQAAPLSHAEVTRLCGEAEGLGHCGRLVETEQLKRLPGLAVRDGTTLKVALFPSGQVSFTDVDTRSGGTTFALWDHFSAIDATLLFTTKDDDASFVLLQRATGRQTRLPAEPALAPDRQRLATADFCRQRCENRLVVWRIARDGVRREAEWQPAEPWADAAVRWQDASTIVVDYTPVGASGPGTIVRRLGEAGWIPLAR